jgi:radical SAM protein with 4Fe4S-binding SPASM domain
MLLEAGIKTNIHFVLGNNSIDRAIHKLKYNEFPDGISAVIFLLHKPVGLGEDSNVLKYDDKRVKEFFELVDNNNFNFKIGFDSCSVPAIINFTKNISDESFDTCEGARFSMYIDADMTALPCSFDQDKKWGYSLLEDTIHNAWNSEAFNNFRHSFMSSCSGCPNKSQCMGGCPIKKQIVLCNKEWI